MPDLLQELKGLDFSVYIGGPLQAAVEAQHVASLSQAEFINDVGFEMEGGAKKLRYVEFKYMKKVPKEDGTGLKEQETTVSVPFISMLTIPSLRIDEMTIDFNVKLEHVVTREASSEFNFSSSGQGGFFFAKFKASTSYTSKSSRGETEQRQYNLSVHVKAVNDELPAGLDRILSLLEDSIAAV